MATRKKTATSLKTLLDKTNAWISKNDLEYTITFSAVASAADVAGAEAKLGVALPRSYAEFVTTFGNFQISGALTGRGDGNDTALLSPAEVVATTLRLRKEFAKSKDVESKKIVEDGIIFAVDPTGEFYHLFVVSSADKTGDMKTRGYDYQDPANTDPWTEGDGTFAEVVEGFVTQVRDNALDG